MRLALLVLACAGVSACTRTGARSRETDGATTAAGAASAPPSALPDAAASRFLPPLAEPTPFVDLDVTGFRPAVVSVPSGTIVPLPVVVALHGNYDRPEWQCGVWRGELGARAFVLCPRGSPRADAPKSEDRWTYAGLRALEAEIVASMGALEQRFARYVDPARPVLVAFSLGAILGSQLLRTDKLGFDRAVLIEGGYESWSAGRAAKLGPSARLLFACGQSGCSFASGLAAKITTRAGVETRVVSGGNVGHTYSDEVARAVRREWEWLVEGDARWAR